jgi:hypothetical protein
VTALLAIKTIKELKSGSTMTIGSKQKRFRTFKNFQIRWQ